MNDACNVKTQSSMGNLISQQVDQVGTLNARLSDLLSQIGGPAPSCDSADKKRSPAGMLEALSENVAGLDSALHMVDKLSCYISG